MAETMQKEWEGFVGGAWTSNVNVRDFIQKNYTPYEGDESFLVGPTATTTELWNEVLNLFQAAEAFFAAVRWYPYGRRSLQGLWL